MKTTFPKSSGVTRPTALNLNEARQRGTPPRLGLIETGTTDAQLAHFTDVFRDGFGEQQLVEFERQTDGTYSLQKLRYQGGSDGDRVIVSAEKMKELWVADRGISG